MNTQTFQIWLDSKLQKLEMHRTDFAKYAGVAYQTLHPWRLQDFDPSMATLIRVCTALAYKLDQPLNVVLYEAIQTTKAYQQMNTQTQVITNEHNR